MKKNNLMVAIIALTVCSETQPSFVKEWWNKQPLEDREGAKAVGITAAALAGTMFVANTYARLFPEAPESKRIQKRETALRFLDSLQDDLNKLIGQKEYINAANSADIAFVKKEDRSIANQLDISRMDSFAYKTQEAITEMKKKITEKIKEDTEKLKKRAELKKKRTYKEWWQGKYNKEDI